MADPIVDDLAELFPDEITVEPFLSAGGSGASTYDTAMSPSPKARISGKIQVVTGQDGREHVSSVQAVLNGVYNVSARDRFTLPQRFSSNPRDTSDLHSRQPRAISVERVSDENGPHHEKVYFV